MESKKSFKEKIQDLIKSKTFKITWAIFLLLTISLIHISVCYLLGWISLIIPILFIILSIFVFFVSRIFYNNDYLNPINLFVVIWLFSIGITTLRLSNLQQTWSIGFWGLIIFNLLIYIFSIFVWKQIKSQNYLSSKLEIKNINLPNNFIKAITLILIIFGYIGFFYIVSLEKQIPLIAINRMDAIQEFSAKAMNYLTMLPLVSVLIFGGFFFSRKKKNPQDTIFFSFLLFASLFYYFILLRRIMIISILLGIFSLYNYLVKKINFFKLIFLFILILVIFVGLGNYRNSTAKNSQEYLSKISQEKKNKETNKISESTSEKNENILEKKDINEEKNNMETWRTTLQLENSSWISWPYLYIAMNLENTYRFYSTCQDRTWGWAISYPLWAFMDQKDLYEKNVGDCESNSYLKNFTTSTYITPFYSDFGSVGVYLGTFILGLLTSFIYDLSQKRQTLFNVIYAIWGFNLIFSVFSNLFIYPPQVFLFIMILIVFLISYFLNRGEIRCYSKKN